MNEGPDTDDFSDLLDAERDIDAPPADVQARMLARLAAALPLSASPPAPSGSASALSGGAGRASGAVGKVLYSALLLAIGAAGGAGAHAALTSRAAGNEAPPLTAPAPIVASIQAPQAPPEPTTASSAMSSATPAIAPASPSSTAAADERARGKAQLKAERLLLEAAQTALRSGDTESALGALRRHARDFPHGQLVEERELLMVQALSASGDGAAARRRATEFRNKFPGSLMQGAVDQASREEAKP